MNMEEVPTLLPQDLVEAIEDGRLNDVQSYLNAGGRLDVPDDQGDFPVHMAARSNQIGMLRFLCRHDQVNIDMENDAGDTALHVAAMNDNYAAVEFLLLHDAAPNAANHDGFTPLHVAAEEAGGPSLISFMVAQGCSVSLTTSKGETPLMLAIKSNRAEVMHALIEMGSDVSALDRDGNGVLHLAANYQSASCLFGLLDQDLEIDLVNGEGKTALELALQSEAFDEADILMAHQACSGEVCPDALSEEAKERLFTPPLIAAARQGMMDWCAHLVEAEEFDPMERHQGKTAGEFALEAGFSQLAAMLDSMAARNKVQDILRAHQNSLQTVRP